MYPYMNTAWFIKWVRSRWLTWAWGRGKYSNRSLFLCSPSLCSYSPVHLPSLFPSPFTIPLPRVVTRDQAGADLFPLSPVLCLTASEMEKFPFSISLCSASAVVLRRGKQGNENRRADIITSTSLIHCTTLSAPPCTVSLPSNVSLKGNLDVAIHQKNNLEIISYFKCKLP